MRLDDDYPAEKLQPLLSSARHYIEQYTGLSADEVDAHEDFCPAVYILCQDMYDNRALYTDKNYINHVFDTILGMHRVNLV